MKTVEVILGVWFLLSALIVLFLAFAAHGDLLDEEMLDDQIDSQFKLPRDLEAARLRDLEVQSGCYDMSEEIDS